MSNKFSRLKDEISKRRTEATLTERAEPGTSDETVPPIENGAAALPVEVEKTGEEASEEIMPIPAQEEQSSPDGKGPKRRKRRSAAKEKEKRPRGRPKGGKRSDERFQQITLYMPKDLYAGVQEKIRSRRVEGGKNYRGPRDMSDLVTRLVEAWDKREQA
jgi:hypothetical protein